MCRCNWLIACADTCSCQCHKDFKLSYQVTPPPAPTPNIAPVIYLDAYRWARSMGSNKPEAIAFATQRHPDHKPMDMYIKPLDEKEFA